jgi:hypothetical protein
MGQVDNSTRDGAWGGEIDYAMGPFNRYNMRLKTTINIFGLLFFSIFHPELKRNKKPTVGGVLSVP